VNTIEGLKGQLTQLQQDHDELITQIPDSMQDTAAVNARLQTVTSTISRLEHALCEAQKAEQNATNTLAAAQANAENAQKQLILEQEALDKATKEWETQLAKSPLSDEAAYQAAIQQTEQSDTLKEQITSHDNALTANTVLLAQLDEQLQDKQRPDLEALQTVLENTQAKVTETLAQRDDANRELQRLTHVADELTKLDAANHNLRAQLDAIEPLAKIANGDTDNKVSLHRYVLGVMLDDVLSVASDHLTHMTRGQFHFERLTDSKGRGGKGLDLGVVDNHTGTLREVSSLSGGESFIASMALALALSQVVQEYAGGIQLETLFIDEGFGSLDSDILQLVINVLSDLQASGRAVGLVSHVEHMKDQFPNKILVHKDSQGSRLEVECVA
jgi:exonuclease SbcC